MSEPSAVPRPRLDPVPLSRLCEALGVDAPTVEAWVSGVVLDSRAVQPGDLYAALPGRVTHGGRFAGSAVAAGAVAVLTDRRGAHDCRALGVPVIVVDDPRSVLGRLAALVNGEPASRLTMLAVTGTNGKTTVAAMVEGALREAGHVTGVIGTTGVRIGDTSYPSPRTTPEATDLHALLARMADDGVDSVIMEASSIAVVERRVDGVLYDVVGFTNLSQDHLDYHGTMEAYFAAKAALFTPAHARQAVVGIDDDWGRRLVRQCTVPVQTWSATGRQADWSAGAPGPDGSILVTGPQGESERITLAMPGSFNVANAVCAFAMARLVGIPAAPAARGIGEAVVAGRLQVVGREAGILGVVDYAHTPDAIERVLEALRPLVPGRLVAVLGAGGDRDRGKRPLMGSVAARLADVVVVTDDNPRSEDAAAIRAAILAGIGPDARAEVLQEGDRRRAITVAVDGARAGDAIVVLGKGHEQGQEVRGTVTPFDDADELRAALLDRASRARSDGQGPG